MISLALLTTLSLMAQPDAVQARTAELAETAGIACYAPKSNRRSTPVRENYFTYSEPVDHLKRGDTFLGTRVGGENKVLVRSPNAVGAVGIVRFTFVKPVAMSRCTSGTNLYAPGRAELKGWGRPVAGEAALPKPPAGPASNFGSHGCYRRDGQTFWGSLVETKSGGYLRRLRVIGEQGEEVKQVSTRRVERLALVECADLPGSR